MSTPFLPPPEDSIHVWCVALRGSVELERAFEQTLSDQEVLRKESFVNPTLRRRFTLSHGVLRVLLSRYLDTCPAKIVFRYGHAGKPFLENCGAEIQFNLSRSDDLALYAFTGKCRVGVDIERIRPISDWKGIAKIFFHKQEYADLLSLKDTEQMEAFFRCWTRKEAYTKAVGQGLSLVLESFQVSLRPEQEAALLSCSPCESGEEWRIRDIAQAGHACAVAFSSAHAAIEYEVSCAAEDFAEFVGASSIPGVQSYVDVSRH